MKIASISKIVGQESMVLQRAMERSNASLPIDELTKP